GRRWGRAYPRAKPCARGPAPPSAAREIPPLSAILTARRSRTSTPSGCCDSERKQARPSNSLLENKAEQEKRRRPKSDEDSPAFRVGFLQRRLQRRVGDFAEDMPSNFQSRAEKPHQP